MKANTLPSLPRTLVVGFLAAFVGQGLMGLLFMNPWSLALLHDPNLQSRWYLDWTPHRDLVPSILGLTVWGLVPAFLFRTLYQDRAPLLRGALFAGWIWGLYWLPQEWFMFVTLMGEPLPLAALELAFAALGCLAQGWLLALGFRTRTPR